jgi:ubiquitin-like 1-activating enzyme E1 B
MSGFEDIEVVDLDTIDVSNLNRQFLFKARHVGQSKAKVAAEAAVEFNSAAKIVSHLGNIKAPEFGASFMKKFDIVFNALDNAGMLRYTRSHIKIFP